MPHPLVASPALQHAQPAPPPHPPSSNNPPDPLDTATDAFHLRSLQSHRPDPKSLQAPIAPSNEPPVPAHNAVVEATVAVPSGIPDLPFADVRPKAVPSGEPAKDRADAAQNGSTAVPLKPVTTLSNINPGQPASETQEKSTPVLISAAKPVEKNPNGDTAVPNATLIKPSVQTSALSSDTSSLKQSAASSTIPQAESDTLMEQKEESSAANLKIDTSLEVIDKKGYVNFQAFSSFRSGGAESVESSRTGH